MWVPKLGKTKHLGSHNCSWRHLGSGKGASEAHKGSPGKTNGSRRGCLETPLGSLGAAWGGSGTSLGGPKGQFWRENRFQTRWLCCKRFWIRFDEVVQRFLMFFFQAFGRLDIRRAYKHIHVRSSDALINKRAARSGAPKRHDVLIKTICVASRSKKKTLLSTTTFWRSRRLSSAFDDFLTFSEIFLCFRTFSSVFVSIS